MLGPKRTDPFEVEGCKSESEQNGHFDPSEDPEEASGQVHEGALERSIHRLDYLASAHGNPPRRRAIGNALS
jgi:hypothetical protein